MRIALATCSNLPRWEVDDRPLHAALAARGVEVALPVWDDPAVDWGRFDACLIRTTWDYMERLEAYLDWAARAAAASRLWNPLGVVRWNTRKSYLGDLAQRGVAVTPTVWLPQGRRADVAEILAERGWERAFLKPIVGATARETLRFAVDAAGVAAAQAHLDRLLPREGMLLQPYLARVESEGERSLVFLDGALSHAVRKVPMPGDYRVQDDFGARDEPTVPSAEELELAHRTLELVERPGLWAGSRSDRLLYARFDFLRDDRGRVLLSELELVEPSLFFRHAPEAAERLAEALLRRLGAAPEAPRDPASGRR